MIGITAAQAVDAGEHYPGEANYQRYLVLPFVSIPEGLLAPGSIEDIADDTDWVQLESSQVFRLIHDWNGKRVVLIGPRKRPISCGRYGWEVNDGTAVLHLFPPTTEYPASGGGCAIQAPSGAIVVRPYWWSGSGAT